jgi:hypothetical protein
LVIRAALLSTIAAYLLATLLSIPEQNRWEWNGIGAAFALA